MPRFIAFQEELSKVKDVKELDQVASLRPTLYIGLGGFGCSVIRRLKKKIQELIPEYADGFGFLGVDTHHYDTSDILDSNEYVELIGINPDNAARQYSALSWYRQLVRKYRVDTIEQGANGIKAVGRIGFQFPAKLQDFVNKLTIAHNNIRQFRTGFIAEPSKVYFISTLAGGTGAGCLLDVIAIVKKLIIQKEGPSAKFQAILATGDALQYEVPAVYWPVLCTNTYATLKEIFYFLTGGEQIQNYEIVNPSSITFNQSSLPNPIFILTSKNENGMVLVKNIEELAEFIVPYLLFEITTPMYTTSTMPKVQDLENSLLTQREVGTEGHLRTFSSIGTVRVGLPYELMEEYCCFRLLFEILSEENIVTIDVSKEAEAWIEKNKIRESGTDELQERIKKDEEGNLITVKGIDTRGDIEQSPDFKYDKLNQLCNRYVKEIKLSYEPYKKVFLKNVQKVTDNTIKSLKEKTKELLQNHTLQSVYSFLKEVQTCIKWHKNEFQKEISEAQAELARLEKEVNNEIGNIVNAAKGWFGRKNRVRNALDSFGVTLKKYLERLIDVWVKDESNKVYDKILEECGNLVQLYKNISTAFEARRAKLAEGKINLEKKFDDMADINRRGPGNRFSLVDAKKAKKLYESIIGPSKEAIKKRCRQEWYKKGIFRDIESKELDWIEEAVKSIKRDISECLNSLSIQQIIDDFYQKDEINKRKLFENIKNLVSPLFPLNPNRKESLYHEYWIIGVHPAFKDYISSLMQKQLAGQGISYAHFDSPFEIIFYNIKHGYTLYSLKEIETYYFYYQTRVNSWRNDEALPPVHGWLDAENWREVISTRTEEEALIYFILGRAFNFLYPNDPNDNTAFIYNRKNYYYFRDENEKEIFIGNGLENAVNNFAQQISWIERIKIQVENLKREKGIKEVKEKLEKDYISILDEEIKETKRSSVNIRQKNRLDVLEKLKVALKRYIDEELRVPKI